MKKSFSLLELIFSLLLLTLLYSMFIPKNQINKLDEITSKLETYLNYTRYKALVDNKYDEENDLWFKKRWSLKFFRCRSSVGGIYFSIYSDKNLSGHPSSIDSLKDPLTNKNIYSSNYCTESIENSKYVLLTKNYNISDIEMSCNSTDSLGQISFGSDGKVYSRLSNLENEENEYEIKEACYIKLIDKKENKKEIVVNPRTGLSKIR